MKKETTGTVISVSKQWWLKINTKAIRKGPMDGAVFPHIIKVSYLVDGKEYIRKKWIGAGAPVPNEAFYQAMKAETKKRKIKLSAEHDIYKKADPFFFCAYYYIL